MKKKKSKYYIDKSVGHTMSYSEPILVKSNSDGSISEQKPNIEVPIPIGILSLYFNEKDAKVVIDSENLRKLLADLSQQNAAVTYSLSDFK